LNEPALLQEGFDKFMGEERIAHCAVVHRLYELIGHQLAQSGAHERTRAVTTEANQHSRYSSTHELCERQRTERAALAWHERASFVPA
jgi:hypothetical protein